MSVKGHDTISTSDSPGILEAFSLIDVVLVNSQLVIQALWYNEVGPALRQSHVCSNESKLRNHFSSLNCSNETYNDARTRWHPSLGTLNCILQFFPSLQSLSLYSDIHIPLGSIDLPYSIAWCFHFHCLASQLEWSKACRNAGSLPEHPFLHDIHISWMFRESIDYEDQCGVQVSGNDKDASTFLTCKQVHRPFGLL